MHATGERVVHLRQHAVTGGRNDILILSVVVEETILPPKVRVEEDSAGGRLYVTDTPVLGVTDPPVMSVSAISSRQGPLRHYRPQR